MAKVSIIVPTYNVEQYLTQCMESIVGQTLKELEIICVNDGSTDGSLGILRKYEQKDDRVIVIDKKNEGYGCAMNDGLDRATGEYIGIVEPDDFVDLHMYEDLYNIAKEKDLDIVKADFYRFICNKKGEFLKTYEALSKDGTGYNMVIDPKENDGIFRYILNTWSGIYRRSFIEKYHIRHNTTPGASFQDNGFWFQTFCLAKRVYFVNRPYYMNRRDNPNSSVKNKEKVYCMNIEYDFIRDIFMQKGNEELWNRFKYYYNYKRYYSYIFTLSRISREFKRGYVERFSREFRRAQLQDELDFNIFTPNARKKLNLLIQNPKMFYWKYVVLAESPCGNFLKKIKRKL